MKKQQDNKTTYTVGFVHGAVFDAGDEVVRGEIREGVDVNKAAIFQATNRARILGTSKEDKKEVAGKVADFKAEVAEQDKELKAYAEEQLTKAGNLAAQVKSLQAELATLRKQVA